MAYVVKDKELNRYTYFNRFVQGMNIIYDHEPIGSIDEATEFEDEDEFKYIMTQLENQGEDVSRFMLCDIDSEKQLIKDEQDKEALSAMANGWDNTSEEGKTEYLKEVLEKCGPDAVAKFLEDIKAGKDINEALANATQSSNNP